MNLTDIEVDVEYAVGSLAEEADGLCKRAIVNEVGVVHPIQIATMTPKRTGVSVTYLDEGHRRLHTEVVASGAIRRDWRSYTDFLTSRTKDNPGRADLDRIEALVPLVDLPHGNVIGRGREVSASVGDLADIIEYAYAAGRAAGQRSQS